MEKRGKFTGSVGFVLAAAGSAVGLGNIWRFPYLAAKQGGGIFLLIYILLVVTFGYTIMVSEIALGRKTGQSPIGAYQSLAKRYSFIGWIAVFVAFIILSYYGVIGGWVIKYFYEFVAGHSLALTDSGFFAAFTGETWQPLLWFFLFMLMTYLVVVNGVEKGIEKVSKVLMPVLVVLSVAIAAYSAFLPGALEGIKYLFIPNFSQFTPMTLLAALGQMFYSMSLAMGIMITYGSYLQKSNDLSKCVKRIEFFDAGISILAAMMIIPAIFSFSAGDSAALSANLNQGPSLMFVTLPKVFGSMPFGGVVGAAFFLLVFFAALTSSISLMECVVSTLGDKWKLRRGPASAIVAGGAFLLGIPSSLGNGIWSSFTIFGKDFLSFFDFITNAVLMPVGALLTCLFIGYVVGVKTVSDEVKISSPFKREAMYNVMIKYIAPICIVAILVTSVLEAFGILTF